MLVKRSFEVKTFTVDLSLQDEIVAGDTLTGTPTVTVLTTPSGAAALTITAIARDATNKKIQFTVSGGTSVFTYIVAAYCATVGGSTIGSVVSVEVTDRPLGNN